MSDTATPIACTLDGPSIGQRVDEIRALLARALKGSRREGPVLHLTFDAAARADVEEMVRKENSCCAFLGFQLSDGDGVVHLAVTAPAGADDLLAPFVLKACAC